MPTVCLVNVSLPDEARSQDREKMFYRMLNDLGHGPQAVHALGLADPGG
ncbi:MAG: hypothetical protein ACNI3A_13265 [Desulfovibrio sp.]